MNANTTPELSYLVQHTLLKGLIRQSKLIARTTINHYRHCIVFPYSILDGHTVLPGGIHPNKNACCMLSAFTARLNSKIPYPQKCFKMYTSSRCVTNETLTKRSAVSRILHTKHIWYCCCRSLVFLQCCIAKNLSNRLAVSCFRSVSKASTTGPLHTLTASEFRWDLVLVCGI